MKNINGTAIALTDGYLETIHAKTTHGLIRGSERFDLVAVIDRKLAGRDAGYFLDGVHRNIPIFATIQDYLRSNTKKADYCIIGVATSGGFLPENMRNVCLEAINNGISVINGLHEYLTDFPNIVAAAKENNIELIDIRKPRPARELAFWSGDILKMKTPRIAVLGIDCAVGKRTTARFAWELCNQNDMKAEMIYTGQTGWLQGVKHGFIFDATLNDFISGEIERVLLTCDKEENPDVIFIEGQSALQNPSGPCGSEFLLSGGAKGVILQHVPFRKKFKLTNGIKVPLPLIEEEVALIKRYGAKVIAITLNNENNDDLAKLLTYKEQLQKAVNIPVIIPLVEGIDGLLSPIREFIEG